MWSTMLEWYTVYVNVVNLGGERLEPCLRPVDRTHSRPSPELSESPRRDDLGFSGCRMVSGPVLPFSFLKPL